MFSETLKEYLGYMWFWPWTFFLVWDRLQCGSILSPVPLTVCWNCNISCWLHLRLIICKHDTVDLIHNKPTLKKTLEKQYFSPRCCLSQEPSAYMSIYFYVNVCHLLSHIIIETFLSISKFSCMYVTSNSIFMHGKSNLWAFFSVHI